MKYDEARQASLKILTNDHIVLADWQVKESPPPLPSHHKISSSDLLRVFFFLWTVYLSASAQHPTLSMQQQCIYFSKYFEGKPEAHSLWVQNFNLETDVLLIFPPLRCFSLKCVILIFLEYRRKTQIWRKITKNLMRSWRIKRFKLFVKMKIKVKIGWLQQYPMRKYQYSLQW